jgi:hypothetical protein
MLTPTPWFLSMSASVKSCQTADIEQRYAQRLCRYTTAMRNEMPDRVPIRPFVAEFTGRYAGYTCQELAHDYQKAFDAACKCAADFEWDAVVANMVYVWTGLAQSLGLKYYAIPGIDVPAETGFQYREPSQDDAFMKPDEYDALIDDPTAFLYNTWLPRVSTQLVPIGAPSTYRNNRALVKTSAAMMQYFTAFGPQVERLQSECGLLKHHGRSRRAKQGTKGISQRGFRAARSENEQQGQRPAFQIWIRVRCLLVLRPASRHADACSPPAACSVDASIR